jgi:hypothetical protein
MYKLSSEERTDKKHHSREVRVMAIVNLKARVCAPSEYSAHKRRKMDRKLKVRWLNMEPVPVLATIIQ